MARKKNPFENRAEETKDPTLLKIGQKVAIIEKHKQGTTDLTEGYIVGLLTTKGVHRQGVKYVEDIVHKYIEQK